MLEGISAAVSETQVLHAAGASLDVAQMMTDGAGSRRRTVRPSKRRSRCPARPTPSFS